MKTSSPGPRDARRPTRQATALAVVPLLASCAGVLTAVPLELLPPAGPRGRVTLPAQGVQICERRAAEATKAPGWAFVAPEAQPCVAGLRRLNTAVGAAPPGGCSAAGIGRRLRVPCHGDDRLFVPA